MCNICVDVKLQRYFFFHIAGGHRGPWGVGDQRRHPPGTREKRTRKTSVVHLGAFKSQLVATVVLSIYIYTRLGLGLGLWDSVPNGSLQ